MYIWAAEPFYVYIVHDKPRFRAYIVHDKPRFSEAEKNL